MQDESLDRKAIENAAHRPFFDGIAGLGHAEPIGAQLRIGQAGTGGQFSTDRNRFFIVRPQRDGTGKKPLHPAFRKFNQVGVSKDEINVSLQQTVFGTLYHAEPLDAHLAELAAYRLPGWEAPPTGEPTCRGDGERAVRWHADENSEDGGHWREIKCPHDLCEFRQPDSKGNRACKPFGRLYFWLKWPTPHMLVKFEHKSWADAKYLSSVFKTFSDFATKEPPKGLGMKSWSCFGLPFVLNLSEETNPKKKRRFPVVRMTPEITPAEFFAAQRQQIEAAGGVVPQLIGARSPEENEPEVLEASHVELSPVPGQGEMF